MRKWLAPFAAIALGCLLLSPPTEARETVTGVITKIDTYTAGDGTTKLYRTIWVKALRVPWALPYLFDEQTEVMMPELMEGMQVTLVVEEATADFVIRTIAPAK